MPQHHDFTTFVALVDVRDQTAQNVQELSAIWGDIRRELERIDVSLESSYALLGAFDFLLTFEAHSTETAFRADTVLERHGLDVQTMEAVDTAEFSELVTDE